MRQQAWNIIRVDDDVQLMFRNGLFCELLQFYSLKLLYFIYCKGNS